MAQMSEQGALVYTNDSHPLGKESVQHVLHVRRRNKLQLMKQACLDDQRAKHHYQYMPSGQTVNRQFEMSASDAVSRQPIALSLLQFLLHFRNVNNKHALGMCRQLAEI